MNSMNLSSRILRLITVQHFRTTEALDMTRALHGGLYGMAQASLKVAESSLGLDDIY